MSASEQEFGGAPGPGDPTEEELRAAYEAELSRISSTDMIAQAAISLLNLGARRLVPDGAGADPQAGTGAGGGAGAQAAAASGRDLEQARDAIDAAGALMEILERRIPQELPPLRDALSRLQMAYAREVSEAQAQAQEPPGGGGDAGEGGDGGGGGEGGEGGQPPPEQPPKSPGPAESSGRLWVPGR